MNSATLHLFLFAAVAAGFLAAAILAYDGGRSASSYDRMVSVLPCLICLALPGLLLRLGAFPLWQVLLPLVGIGTLAALPVKRNVLRWAQLLAPAASIGLVVHFLAVSHSSEWMARNGYPDQLVEYRREAARRCVMEDVLTAGYRGKEAVGGTVEQVFPDVPGPCEACWDVAEPEWHSTFSGIYRRKRSCEPVVYKGGVVTGDIEQFTIGQTL